MTLAAKKMKTVTLHTKTYVTIIRQERGGDTFLFKITPKKSTVWYGLILQNIPSIPHSHSKKYKRETGYGMMLKCY